MRFSRHLLVHIPGASAKAIAEHGGESVLKRTNVLGSLSHRTLRSSTSLRTRIGVWDLGAWLSTLPQLVDRMNAIQRSFSFFIVHAMVPSGLIREKEGVVAWYDDLAETPLNEMEREELKSNVISKDFFAVAERVRSELPIDYLVGVTPSMVAGEDDEDLYYNYFSTFEGRLALVSTADLREFSAQTNQPLETFLGVLILAQVLVAMNYPKLGYHPDSGCLFDKNEDRISLKTKIKDLHIERTCLDKIPKEHHSAVQSLINLLRNYSKP